MNLLRHVARLVWETLAFGLATRRVSLVVVVLLGLLLVALVVSAQAAVPFVVYPFA